MGVIFDSCIWVALGSGQLTHESVIATTGEASVYASAVSLGELRFGVEACGDAGERARRSAFLRQVERRPVLDVTRHTAAAFGVLAASVRGAGRSPRARYNDLWLAAQAIEHGFALLTLNAKDFAGLPGLHLLQPH